MIDPKQPAQSWPSRWRDRSRLWLRRIGYRTRGVQILLSLTVENSFLFSLLLIIPTAVVTIGITVALTGERTRLERIVWIALSVGVPLALLLYLYLRSVSRAHRADLAIRARRHDDGAVLMYVFKLAEQLLDFIRSPSSPQSHLRRASDRDLALSFLRVRAAYLGLVMDQAAHHFRVTREALEEAIGSPARVLENLLCRRVLLHYELAHRPERIGSAKLEIEAHRIDRRLDNVQHHLAELTEIAVDFARVLRTIVKQPSTGLALAEAASVLKKHLDHETRATAVSLIDLRRGVPLTRLLGWREFEERIDERREAVKYYLGRFRDLQETLSEDAVDRATDLLTKTDYLPRGAAVLTVGYSRMVARALSQVALRRSDFTVGIVVPSVESEWEWDKVVFADEDRMMAAEIAADDTLRDRVFRIDPNGLDDLSLDWRTAILISGAEAVTFEGVLLHPRGRLSLHRQLESYLRSERASRRTGYRYAVAESFKFVHLTPREITTRLLASIGPDEYDVLITDQGVLEGNARRRLGSLMSEWHRRVDRILTKEGPGPVFSEQGAPRAVSEPG